MLSAPFFKTAKEISGSEPTTVWIASAKRTWCRSFSPSSPMYAVLAAGDAGDVWVENLSSMVRVHGGRADRGHPIPSEALSAYRDPSGAIWWLCLDAIYRYNAGSYTRIALPPSFPKPYVETGIAATEDGSGALWLAAEREGLFYRKKGVWHRLETASEFAKLIPQDSLYGLDGPRMVRIRGGHNHPPER